MIPTTRAEYPLALSDTLCTAGLHLLLLDLQLTAQNIHLPTACASTTGSVQTTLAPICSSISASPSPAHIAAVLTKIYAHDLLLLPVCLFPFRTLQQSAPESPSSLQLPLLPIDACDILGPKQNDISNRKPHGHLPSSIYFISPLGCQLSSPQLAAGFSAGSFIKGPASLSSSADGCTTRVWKIASTAIAIRPSSSTYWSRSQGLLS